MYQPPVFFLAGGLRPRLSAERSLAVCGASGSTRSCSTLADAVATVNSSKFCRWFGGGWFALRDCRNEPWTWFGGGEAQRHHRLLQAVDAELYPLAVPVVVHAVNSDSVGCAIDVAVAAVKRLENGVDRRISDADLEKERGHGKGGHRVLSTQNPGHESHCKIWSVCNSPCGKTLKSLTLRRKCWEI